MYDPGVGRWLEEDPLTFEAGDSNLYRYVKNNSVNRIDPDGESDKRLPAVSTSPYNRKRVDVTEPKSGINGELVLATNATFNGDTGVYITYIGAHPEKVRFFQFLRSTFTYSRFSPSYTLDPRKKVVTESLSGSYEVAGGATHSYGNGNWDLDDIPSLRIAYYSSNPKAAGRTGKSSWIFDSPSAIQVIKSRSAEIREKEGFSATFSTDFVTYMEAEGKLVAQAEWQHITFWTHKDCWLLPDVWQEEFKPGKVSTTLGPEAAARHRKVTLAENLYINEGAKEKLIEIPGQILR